MPARPRSASRVVSSDAAERDDGKVGPAVEASELEDESSLHAPGSASRKARGIGSSEGVARAGLPGGRRRGGLRSVAQVGGRAASEALVRTVVVVPEDVGFDLAAHGGEAHREDGKPGEELGLQGAEEAFDESDAAALSDGAEARTDPTAAAPVAVVVLKLGALIGEDVPGGDAGATASGVEEASDVACGGLSEEEPARNDGAGVVVEDSGEPEAEGPALEESLREPRHPEAGDEREEGEVDVPDVVGVACGDGAGGSAGRRGARGLGGLGRPRRRRAWCLAHARDGSDGKVKSGASEELSEPDLSHRGEGAREAPDDVAHEVGEAVDRLGQADEGCLAVLIEATHPVGDCLLGDLEASSGVGDGPSAGSAEREDGEPRGGRVVRAPRRRDVLEAGPEDASLLLERSEPGECDVALGDEANASDAAVEAPAADMGGDEVCESEGVEDGGPRVLGPGPGQGNVPEHRRHVSSEARRRGAGARRSGPSGGLGDASDDAIEIREDLLLTDAEDAPTEPGEGAVPRGVPSLAAVVVAAVDLDDEAHGGAGEVADEGADDELTAEGEAGLGAGEPAPEPLLGAGGSEAHAASMLLEELSASRRDEVTSEHERLREGRTRECAERSLSRRFRAARSRHLCRSGRLASSERLTSRRARGAERARCESPAHSRVRTERDAWSLAARAEGARVGAPPHERTHPGARLGKPDVTKTKNGVAGVEAAELLAAFEAEQAEDVERSGAVHLRRRASYGVDFETMQQPLKARVRNGRLVLDEPTDLPEGEEVELVLADADDMDDDLSEDERRQLDESIAVSFEQAKNGQLIDGDEVLAKLRAIR